MSTGNIRGGYVAIGSEAQVVGQQIFHEGPTYTYNLAPTSLPPVEVRERHELGILLGKVKQFWIEGVLEKSVHTIALIELGKETQTEAVVHAWEQVLELPDQSRQTLPPDKKISYIFDDLNRTLLILGEPGSGKTTTLLQLAHDLIIQAEQDESFVQPIPVVFNLSSWLKGQLMFDWLVAELSIKYQIPRRIGRIWLENHRLLPLLDGLDEVKSEHRALCVKAINAFADEYGLAGLVVCSRLQDYLSLPVRLRLNGAIRLLPLTLEQVYDYLEGAGSRLEALRTTLEVDDGLQTLAQSPLTLGIMSLAYQDISVESLLGEAHNTLETRRKHLFDTYIERMFRRKGKNDRLYSPGQTKRWLAWLAQQMRRHDQSIFLIEQLQPSWLASRSEAWAYLLIGRTIGTLTFGLMAGLIMFLNEDRILKFSQPLVSGWGGWLLVGFVCTLIVGSALGFIDAIILVHHGKLIPGQQLSRHQRHFLTAIVVALGFVVIGGLVNGVFTGFWFGLVFGLYVAFFVGIYWALRGSALSLVNDIKIVEALHWSWQKSLKRIPVGLIGGLINGLIIGQLFGQNQDLVISLQHGILTKLLGERFSVIGMGLAYCLFGGILAAMTGGLSSRVVDAKTTPNQGIGLSLKNSLLVGPAFGLTAGLVGWLIFWLVHGFQNGTDLGVAWGLLTGTLAFGWYGGYGVINHYLLRLGLWTQGQAPLNYARFLDYATEHILLQKVGGGYIFIHRLLLEHFAAMAPDDNHPG